MTETELVATAGAPLPCPHGSAFWGMCQQCNGLQPSAAPLEVVPAPQEYVAPEAPRPPSPWDAITNVNAVILDRTGRVSDSLVLRAAAFMTSALALGYPNRLFKGTSNITGATLRRERKKVMKWLRENRPDVVAKGKAFQKKLDEMQSAASSAATPSAVTTPSATSETLTPEPLPPSPPPAIYL